jgi:hypothetical protein
VEELDELVTAEKFVDTLTGAKPVGNVTVNTPVCAPVNVPVGIVAGAVGVNIPLLIVPRIAVPPAGVNVAGALAGRLEPVNVIVGSVEPEDEELELDEGDELELDDEELLELLLEEQEPL